MDDDDEAKHRDFLLHALRAASLRAKLMDADLTTIGVALKGGLIGADTAVAWIRDAGLSWMVGALPADVGRIATETSISTVTPTTPPKTEE